MGAWNYASIWEVVADQLPEADALVHEDRRRSWAELDRRADGLARSLLQRGVGRQDKVGQYLYNGPEYLESMFACFKAGLVPVNTNYRYQDDELVYLWDNADVVAVVFHGTFAERIDRIRDRLPRVGTWLWVDDGTSDCPPWATPYEEAATGEGDRLRPPWGRGEDDLLLMYTGGTTGMPKGVMWRQDSLVRALGTTNPVLTRKADDTTDADLRELFTAPGLRLLPACPLMHATGQFTALMALTGGGAVVTTDNRRFDAEHLLDVAAAQRVNMLAIVGDTFARPIVAALDAHPGRWDLSALIGVASSGVMWSHETKEALLAHLPTLLLIDAFSSSEALGLGQSVSTSGGASGTARFTLGDTARVIDDEGREVTAGSGRIGRVAVRGHTPLGYYKDPEKTAATFVRIDGESYSIPGDYATVEADGTLTLLGRGSLCINTGGEKVFPEEVEEVLKEHPAVRDAVVVGLPDERFGQRVTAVVELHPGEVLDEVTLVEEAKARIAAFKAPRQIVFAPVLRAPNGKADYAGNARLAAESGDRVGPAPAGR